MMMMMMMMMVICQCHILYDLMILRYSMLVYWRAKWWHHHFDGTTANRFLSNLCIQHMSLVKLGGTLQQTRSDLEKPPWLQIISARQTHGLPEFLIASLDDTIRDFIISINSHILVIKAAILMVESR